MKENQTDFKAKQKREVIGNLVKMTSQDFRNPSFWSREMKLFKELFELYPDPVFWQNLDMDFQLNSLAWFKKGDGADLIKRKWNLFKFVPPKEEPKIILEEKVGESIIDKVKPKKQTLMEFLDA